jgi:hypothetical protein
MHDLGDMVGDKVTARILKPHPLRDLLSSSPDQNSVAEGHGAQAKEPQHV